MPDINTNFDLGSLTGNVVPADVYLRLAKQWNARHDEIGEELLRLNMLEYYDAIPSFYDDRESAASLVLPYWAERTSSLYPRLTRLARTLPKGERATKHAMVEQIMHGPRMKYQAEYIANLNRWVKHETASPTGATSLFADLPGREYSALDIPRFNIHNVRGQHVAGKAADAMKPAIDIIRLGLPIMQAWCEENGAEFELRPPIAFPGSIHDRYVGRSADMPGLDTQLTPGAAAVMNTLAVLGDLFPESYEYGEMNRRKFDWWASTAATAAIRHHGAIYALMPAQLPSVLFRPNNALVHIVIRETPTLMIEDTTRIVWQYGRYDESVDWEFMCELALPRERITLLMSLLAFAASIISFNTKTGSGQRKPYWTHTPINAATIDVMLRFAPLILRNARELVQ